MASKHAAEKEAASEAVSQHVIISLLKTRKVAFTIDHQPHIVHNQSHRHMTMEGFVYVLWLGVYFSIIILHRNPSQASHCWLIRKLKCQSILMDLSLQSFLIEEAVRQQLFERRTTQLGRVIQEYLNLQQD